MLGGGALLPWHGARFAHAPMPGARVCRYALDRLALGNSVKSQNLQISL